MPEMRRDGYLAVGAGCTPFETEVDLAQVEQLRDVLQLEFFDALPVRTPLLTDEADKSMCARAFHDRSDPELESLPSIFAAGIIHNYSPESWRMTVMHTKLRRARHNNSQQRVESRLNFEVWDRQVVEAVRRVRIARGVGELTVEAVEKQMVEDASEGGSIVTQRRAFERQITPSDCDAAAELLRQVARRSLVSDRQRPGWY